mmetsp:Transcript_32961/g.50420  ORF Transcript_32961/g.50420 Transcript_32961/m.50420 type:complete len:266 (+) Transcript_32961:124-921(+)
MMEGEKAQQREETTGPPVIEDVAKKTTVGGAWDIVGKRPAMIQFWISYMMPLRLFGDIIFLFSNPEAWRAGTRDWTDYNLPRNLVSTATDPDYMILNKDVPLTFIMVMCSCIIPNAVELYFGLFFRERFARGWKVISIHHGLLIAAFYLVNQSGRGMTGTQVCISCLHTFIFPVVLFPNWKYWKDENLVFGLGCYVVVGLILMSIAMLWFFVEVLMAPPFMFEYHYFVMPMLVFHNGLIISSIVKILNGRGLMPSWLAETKKNSF